MMPTKIEAQREALVEKVVEQMREGKPFFWDNGYTEAAKQGARRPFNVVTNKAYQGGNSFKLSFAQYVNESSDPRWCTFMQAKSQGWHIKKGEKGTQIEVWKMIDPNEKADTDKEKQADEQSAATDKKTVRPGFYRVASYTVFNAKQIEGIPPLPQLTAEEKKAHEQHRIAALETMIAHSEAPIIKDQIARNFYSLSKDEIHIMPEELFKNQDFYYGTVAHEIGHSTGHESRLHRQFGTWRPGKLATPEYAKEELRAELTAMFLQQEYGLQFTEEHFQNHAAYLESWATALKRDPNELYRAAADAEKAFTYIKTNMIEKYMEAEQDKTHTHERQIEAVSNGKESAVKRPCGISRSIEIKTKRKSNARQMAAAPKAKESASERPHGISRSIELKPKRKRRAVAVRQQSQSASMERELTR